MLENCYQKELPEAGCDEAGRGCLAGPVFAAAVMLPPDFSHPLLNDSKQMTERNREKLRAVIEREAVAWAPKQARKAGPKSESEPNSGQNRRNATGISGDVDPPSGRPTNSAQRPSN